MKKTILKKLMIGLLTIILAFSIVTYLIITLVMDDLIKENIVDEIVTKQYIVVDMWEILYEGVEHDLSNVLYTRDILNIMQGDEFDSAIKMFESVYDIYGLQRMINSVAVTSSYIETIYIHFLDYDYVISSDYYACEDSAFYDTGWLEESALFEQENPYMYSGAKVQYDSETLEVSENYVRCIFPYYYVINGERVLVVANCDTSIISDVVESDDAEGILMLNEQFIPFYADMNPEIEVLLQEYMDDLGEEFFAEKENHILIEDHIISYVTDEHGNYYIHIVDYEEFSAQYSRLILFIYGIAGIVIFLLTVVWYRVMMRIYSPVNQMVTHFNTSSHMFRIPEIKDDKNLLASVEELIEKARYNEVLRKQNQVFDELIQKYDSIGTGHTLNKKYFSAARIIMDDTKYKQLDMEVKQSALEEIVIFLQKQGIFVLARTVKMGFECIINYDTEHKIHRVEYKDYESTYLYTKNAEDLLQSVADIIKKKTNMTATIGVGDVYTDIHHVHLSYEEALSRARQRLFLEPASIILGDDIESKEYTPIKETVALTKAIEQGDIEKIIAVFEEIKEDVRTKKVNIGVEHAPLFVYYLCYGISAATAIKSSNKPIGHAEIAKMFEEGRFDDIIDYLKEYTLEIVQIHVSTNQDKLNILNVVSNYVRDNFYKDIDVTTIASDLGISYTQLRKILLKESGVNIVDYINKLRIKEAKNLLVNSNMTMAEISAHVGYNNEQSFNRYFKKFEQITPGEYRKMNS
ncbi:MAG: helix-turn-helix domain-containing protein [Lachnospiraceae bacterium]